MLSPNHIFQLPPSIAYGLPDFHLEAILAWVIFEAGGPQCAKEGPASKRRDGHPKFETLALSVALWAFCDLTCNLWSCTSPPHAPPWCRTRTAAAPRSAGSGGGCSRIYGMSPAFGGVMSTY
eukprot:NODE_16417_length_996_cov_1.869965.p3 GENE.NODE_16417_length_996_cov_1.869965~~NODE_16417_length_996_cov_1.869965.p3  ORF type:complete len:122 (+),score=9.19 NODE_16417_length_996_cov_1.869965:446-811(+)